MENTSNLLPNRHPTRDFFIADIFDNLPIKNDMASMEYPIFSLSTKPCFETLEYQFANSKISIVPSAKYGLPTIFDKDILLYLGSILMMEINQGYEPSKKIRLSVHDLLIKTNRMTNGISYKQIKNAFDRLASVYIRTNIKTNKIEIDEGFGMLESWRIIKGSKDKDRMIEVEATVSDWFYNSLIGKEVLTIHPDYFRLRKSLERRLYEIARKYCGKQKQWKISLQSLQQKTGSKSPEKKFRLFIRDIVKHNHLPQYEIYFDGKDTVYFMQKVDLEKQLSFEQIDNTLNQIRNDTFRKCQEIARKSRLDYYEIEHQFKRYINTNGIPDCPNGAMVGFFKKKASGQ